jgi:hypothetical protein
MGKHNFPSTLNISNIENLLNLWHRIVNDKGTTLEINFDKVFYLTPFSVCFIESLFDVIHHKGVEKLAGKLPNVRSAFNQFERMGFFTVKGDKFIKTNGRTPTLPISKYAPDLSLDKRVRINKTILDFVKDKIQMTREVSFLLYLSLKEIIENAFTHGQSEWGCYVCANAIPQKKLVRVCFLDRGVGFYNSLKNKYPHIRNSPQAIEEALKYKVSQFKDPERGLGLYVLKYSIEKNQGDMTIVSYDGKYEYVNYYRKGESRLRENAKLIGNFFPGTIIDLVIKADPNYKFSDNHIEEVF